MASCRVCKCSLSESVHRPGGKYKSCPNCSRIAGVHAYYPTESFGLRTMADGNQIFNPGALLVVLAVLVSLHPFVSLFLRSELYIVPNIIAVRATRWVSLFVCKP